MNTIAYILALCPKQWPAPVSQAEKVSTPWYHAYRGGASRPLWMFEGTNLLVHVPRLDRGKGE